MTQVFISYSRKDLDFVERLSKDLQAGCLNVWYDLTHLEAGQEWVSEIEIAIRQSQYLIVILSPDSAKSTWVEREVLFAEDLGLKIVPVLLRECDLPIWSKNLQYIDVRGKNYELQLEELRKALDAEQLTLTNNKIDCVILCGGYSKRLWPLTIDISKVLLPVAGKPVLEYVINFVQESQFINQIVLSVNQKFAPQIEDYIELYRSQNQFKHPINIKVEPSTQEKEKLGPVGALQYIVSESVPRDLLVLGGDNIFGFCLDDFLDFIYKTGGFWSCNAIIKDRDQNNSEYGQVKLDSTGRFFLSLVEKPEEPTYKHISTACYFLKKRDVEAIQEYIRADKNPDSLGGFIDWLTTQSRIMSFAFPSFWFDVGTPQALIQANRHFLVHSIPRNDNRTEFIEHVYIDPSSEVSKSKLGPNVYIGPGVQVANSTICNSIIMEKCVITGIKINNCVIGPESIIEGKHKEGKPVEDAVFAPKSRVSKYK